MKASMLERVLTRPKYSVIVGSFFWMVANCFLCSCMILALECEANIRSSAVQTLAGEVCNTTLASTLELASTGDP